MSLAQRAAAGAKWSVVSVAGRHVVIVLTSVILARLLSPADFGLVAMAAVFTRFIELIRDLGTGAAIVQAESSTDRLLSSLFWLNVGLGAAASLILLFGAPLAAGLLREPRLTSILKVLSMSPLVAALSVVQTSLLARDLKFRRLAIIELTGVSAGGIIGIVLALQGFAAWSLVWQSICTVFIMSGGAWLASRWRPRLTFHLTSVRPIVGYSANLTGFNILNHFVRYADNLLIGRYLGATDLGVYDLAYRLMLLPLQYVSAALGRALFPVFTRMQTDPRRLGEAYLRATAASALVAFPILFGLGAIAGPLVSVVLGASWSRVVSLLLIFGPLGALQAITTSVNNIYQAVGRADLLFRFGAVTGVATVISFIVGLQWGIVGVAASYAVVSATLAYPVLRVPLRLIDLAVRDLFLRAVGRPLLCSVIMGSVLLAVQRLLGPSLDDAFHLAVLISTAALVYASATWLYNRDSAEQLIALARRA